MKNQTKTLFAISGSLRSGSSNHHILNFLKDIAPSDVTFIIYDELALIPPFDPGIDNDTTPPAVARFRKLIANADALIICTPEYAYGVPGQLKNALDWTVSSGSLSDKPAALITASTGGGNAHEAMIKILGALNAVVPEDRKLLISFVRSKMDSTGNIIDEQVKGSVIAVFDSLLSVA